MNCAHWFVLEVFVLCLVGFLFVCVCFVWGGIVLIFHKEAHILSVHRLLAFSPGLREVCDWGSPSTLKQAVFPLLIPLQTWNEHELLLVLYSSISHITLGCSRHSVFI